MEGKPAMLITDVRAVIGAKPADGSDLGSSPALRFRVAPAVSRRRGRSARGLSALAAVVAALLGPASHGLASPLVTPPEITTQPASATVCEGDSATFTVVATGEEPIAYQWRKDGSD